MEGHITLAAQDACSCVPGAPWVLSRSLPGAWVIVRGLSQVTRKEEQKLPNSSTHLSQSHPPLKKKKIIYFWLCWVFIAPEAFLVLLQAGATSLVAVHGLSIAVASLLVEHRL